MSKTKGMYEIELINFIYDDKKVKMFCNNGHNIYDDEKECSWCGETNKYNETEIKKLYCIKQNINENGYQKI